MLKGRLWDKDGQGSRHNGSELIIIKMCSQ